MSHKIEDEEILSESDSEYEKRKYESGESDLEAEETVQEKKIRLAKRLIEEIEKQKEDELGDKDQNAFVARKLEEDLQTKTGKLRREIAHRFTSGTIEKQFKGHKLSVTCVAVSTDLKTIFSGSKDGSIIKWNNETGVKMNTIKKKTPGQDSSAKGHKDEVLCIALSFDSKFLASGGKDKSIKIWNPVDCEFIYSFEGHRDFVSGLVFRKNSHQLFSCSFDRSVKIWNVDQLAYVETLFGHQDKILGIDSLSKERCVSCGARDRSVRLWKIVEESQLLFNGVHFDSIDCVSMLNEETYITGSNESSLAVWSSAKKKPIFTFKNAHNQNGDKTEPSQTSWISAVATFHNTDLIASGSDDGFIRFWSYSDATMSLSEKFKVAVDGFVNELRFSEDGNYLVAAVGQEHKLGRWTSIKKAKNSIVCIKMNIIDEEKNKVKH